MKMMVMVMVMSTTGRGSRLYHKNEEDRQRLGAEKLAIIIIKAWNKRQWGEMVAHKGSGVNKSADI